MSRKKTVQKLTREDWLENALTILSRKGPSALRIEGLSAALGVSRGSFYWHFKDRNDFIHALLEYWHEEYTVGALAAVERDGGTPEERLLRLMRIVHDHDLSRHDLTVRSLATLDSQFSKTVIKTDRFRLDFIQSLFLEMGFTDDQRQIRARACLAYMTVEHIMLDQLDRKHRSDLADSFHAFLVRK